MTVLVKKWASTVIYFYKGEIINYCMPKGPSYCMVLWLALSSCQKVGTGVCMGVWLHDVMPLTCRL